MEILQYAHKLVLAENGRSGLDCLFHLARVVPSSPHAWQLLAHVHMTELGQTSEGIKFLQSALAASPGNVEYLQALGQVIMLLCYVMP